MHLFKKNGKDPKTSRTKGWRPLVLAALAGAALAIVLVAAFSNFQTAQPSSAASTTIKNSLSDISELSTEEYSFANVGKYTEDDLKVLGISIPFTGSSFVATYEGTVKAGISDIEAADVAVDDSTKTVTVTLPDVEILSCSIDPSTIEVYDQTFNPINQIQVSDVSNFLSSEEDKEEEEAKTNGTLDKARTHAEKIVKSVVSSILSGISRDGYAVKVSWTTSGTDTSADAA
ncbi:DUF4230 domain-containing protein [Olsenella sp. AGMB03486]|uniref:DUF4230 domain-containing protein n=1 Tax=Olsenella sp. AGMB03486 TaxID=3230364 RepID=UPI0034A03BE7